MSFCENARKQASLSNQAYPQDCLSPQPSHRKMVYLENVDVERVKLHCPEGMTLYGHYINASGLEECETTICLPPDTTAYFSRSTLKNRYFVTYYDNYRGYYRCTCKEVNCSHVRAIEALSPLPAQEWRNVR